MLHIYDQRVGKKQVLRRKLKVREPVQHVRTGLGETVTAPVTDGNLSGPETGQEEGDDR